jgi:CrcB protein
VGPFGRWSPPAPTAVSVAVPVTRSAAIATADAADDSYDDTTMARAHPLARLEAVLLVGIGGFAGSNLRYFVESVVPSSLVATTTVNVLGCLALGVLLYEEQYGGAISRPGRTILATGFVASFTTYSTFVVDTLETAPGAALGYVAGSYALGFAAVVLGREAARRVTDSLGAVPEVDG